MDTLLPVPLFALIGILIAYYVSIIVYVLAIQMHLSVTRITSKLPITDSTSWASALLQFILAISLAHITTSSNVIILVLLSCLASLFIVAVFELWTMLSPPMIILQMVGIAFPAVAPGPVGIIGAIIALSLSITPEPARIHTARYDKLVAKLVDRYSRRYQPLLKKESVIVGEITIAIIVTEVLSRPVVFRQLERIAKRTFMREKMMSTGIMQVTSSKALSDDESVEKGIALVHELRQQAMKAGITNPKDLVYEITKEYNGSKWYANYLMPIYEYIHSGRFPR